MVYVLLVFALLYGVLLVGLILGWRKAVAPSAPAEQHHSFSVIVPFRNEANVIAELLEALRSQQYPKFEVLLVDDHSTDNSVEVIRRTLGEWPNYRILYNEGQGKKMAITTGVNHAEGQIIVTTDADCSMYPDWLNHIRKMYVDAGVVMVVGGVSVRDNGTFFSKLQSLEFSSLIGSSAALVGLGHPVMCNGANLSFRTVAFLGVNGYVGNLEIASGDDEFLMRKLHAAFPRGIRFLSEKRGVVFTKPAPSRKSFWQQRIRWASKWKYNSSLTARMLAVLICLFQITWIAAFSLAVVAQGTPLYIALGALALRLVGEIIFLYPVCSFLQVPWRWGALFTLEVVYPFYVIGIGLFSNFLPNSWKGRKI
jgi:cellulose synthase/poly-beta-1,6-N-acetylglucosamine synthase-like glycosyltransferase